MKRLTILSVLLTILLTVSFSQQSDSNKNTREFQTLLGNNSPRGFYGSFTVGYSEINSDQAVLFGGRIMWIAGHSFGFGFGGSGFINEYHYEPALDRDVFLTGGYGGLYIEPILLPKFPVHLSFPCLLGAGGISYISKDMNDYHNMIEDSEAFLIAEPAAELELNLTHNFRISFGASYRFTTPFEIGSNAVHAVNAQSVEGFSYMMTFKFGRF